MENFCFLSKIFSKSCYIYVCVLPETSNFHNSDMIGQRNDWSEKWLVREIIGQRKLPDSSMNNVFNVLSIGLHCTLSFKRPDFGLKCLVTTTPKVQSLKFKSMYKWNRRIVPHFLNLLIVIELLLWNRKERQNAVDYVLFKAFRVLAGIVLYL